MPRPRIGRVGRSAGVAEHRVAKRRTVISLSRTTSLTRAIALGCVVALSLTWSPATASAQGEAPSIASTRAAIDATAAQWFGAQRRAADLDRQIATLIKTLAATRHHLAGIRRVANARSVQLYEDSAQGLDTVIGGDPLELGRRAALIGPANADAQHAIDELGASVADLNTRRAQLGGARNAQQRAIRDLASRRRTLDAELASLELRSAQAAERTVPAAATRRIASSTHQTAPTGPTTSARSAPAPASVVAPKPVAQSAVVPPPDTGAVNSHHDAPFLVCTRTRESNGAYSAVSSSGYYGAYQFAPTTWNVAANHAGRLDLVGVMPSRASQYDQDELAWSLYQWEGNTPWGGRC